MATKRRRRAATLDHNAELWAHIEPESSRLLLLSALDAFLARGFHAATTREIAERAGMSPAAVYVHWRAKHDLLFEISRIGHQAVLDVVEQALEQASDDPVERVHAFVSAFATLARGEPRAGARHPVRVQEAAAAQFRRIVEIRDRFEELMRDELAGGVAAGASTSRTSRARRSRCSRCASTSPAGTSRSPSTAPPEAVGELYAGPRDPDAPRTGAKQALGLVGSRAGVQRPTTGEVPDGDLMRISHRARLARSHRAR